MKGNRGPFGLTHRNQKQISGRAYIGDPDGQVQNWASGAIDVPTIGGAPSLALPVEDVEVSGDDDGTDIVPTRQRPGGANVVSDNVKARVRLQFKSLANWIAKLSQKATATDSDFVFSDDFVGAVVDTSKWIITGTSADATIIGDEGNGGFGAVALNPTTNGDAVALNTRAFAVGTKDFICAMRFRFGAPLDSTKASFILGMYGAFWLESNAATSAVYLRYDGGGVFPANTFDTGLLVSDTAYHEVQIKRLLGTLYLIVDGVLVVSFADAFSGAPGLFAQAVDTTAPAELVVDYIKTWVAR